MENVIEAKRIEVNKPENKDVAENFGEIEEVSERRSPWLLSHIVEFLLS